jgi:subtilisin family serine protease
MHTPYDLITDSELDTATGKGVRVLVMDSGVEASHPALRDHSVRCWQTSFEEGSLLPRVQEDGGEDLFGHGTAVAAILHHYAPNAQIESLRVLGGDCRSSSVVILAGLHWAIEHGYHVVNCSFTTPNRQYLAEYKRVVDRAFCSNVILVSACNNFDFSRVEYPGSFPTVLSTDKGRLEGLALQRRLGQLVEFVASGHKIRAAWKGGQYRRITGTSLAAPHLAALVARILEIRPGWNACQIKAALYEVAQTV